MISAFVRIVAVAGMWVFPHLPIADCAATLQNDNTYIRSTQLHHLHDENISINNDVADAMNLLLSMGVPPENFCSSYSEVLHLLPLCNDGGSDTTAYTVTFDRNSLVRSRRQRYLQEKCGDLAHAEGEKDIWFLLAHALCALACVAVAALAAGLTMGLLSLDPLLLLIRMRAGSTEEEKQQAATLLPIVKQHHLLLVTLLLLNSIANEALPLFLVRLSLRFEVSDPESPNSHLTTLCLFLMPGSSGVATCCSRPFRHARPFWRRNHSFCHLYRTQQD